MFKPKAVGCAAWAACAACAAWASPAFALTEQDCINYVRSQAALMYRVPESNVNVKWDGPRLGDLVAHPPKEATLALSGSQFRLSGTMPVPLQVFDRGNRVTTIYPRLAITVQQEVAVSRDRISRGRILDLAAVRIEKRPVSGIYTQPFTSLVGLVGAMAKMDIPPGTVLTGSMVEVPPVVKSGANVSVRVKCGGLLILSSGQVLQDGRPGQLVRVLNTKSQKDFLAKVVGPDVVDVEVEPDNGEEQE